MNQYILVAGSMSATHYIYNWIMNHHDLIPFANAEPRSTQQHDSQTSESPRFPRIEQNGLFQGLEAP